MSAQDNLSPKQFFHGSPEDIKDAFVVPRRPNKHVWFTAQRSVAESWARGGHVYTVEPLPGSYEPDPEMHEKHQAYRSKISLRITGREKL